MAVEHESAADRLTHEAEPLPPVRAVIVDADVPTRVGVRMILSSVDDIEVVAEAASGEDAVAQAFAHQPDVVVTAIRLPGVDGITATQQITAALGDRTRVVVLTSFDTDEYERQARRAGASAFVSKHAAPGELIGAVRAVATGARPPVPQQATGRSDLPPAFPDAALCFTPRLTDREHAVLSLVAEGLSNTEVGQRLHISLDTVKSHLSHIYAKSGVVNRTRLVVEAQASGFSSRST
jgi:DNA-binding NarL/FixJ family response regulator